MSRFTSFVAARYLFSRGRFRAVHLVTLISAITIAVIVAASVVILSVFNGYGTMLLAGATPFDAELLLRRTDDALFSRDNQGLRKVLALKEVAASSELIYGEAVVAADNSYQAARLIGVDECYTEVNDLKPVMHSGDFDVKNSGLVVGAQLFMALGMPDEKKPLMLLMPRRTEKINPLAPLASLLQARGRVTGVVLSNNEQYNNTLFLSADSLRKLLDLPPTACHAMALKLSDGKRANRDIKRMIAREAGEGFVVLDRSEQQAGIVRLVALEKWLTYCILAFITFLAAFNVICSSSLLILEKQRDTRLFSAIGARRKDIRRIFVGHSLGITSLGTVCGLIFGLLLCLLQQSTGLFTFTAGITQQAYPVEISFTDLLPIVAMVLLLGFFAAFLPARALIKNIIPLGNTA